MTGTSFKSQIGGSDIKWWDGLTDTFIRKTSTGGDLTQNKFSVLVDALEAYGGGTAYTRGTIKTAVDSIGTAYRRGLVLRPGDWVIDDDLTIPANITLLCPPGVNLQVATTKTLSIGNLEAGIYRIFTLTGTGTVLFPSGLREIYPEWWQENTATSADWSASFQAANDSIVTPNGIISLGPRTYRINTAINVGESIWWKGTWVGATIIDNRVASTGAFTHLFGASVEYDVGITDMTIDNTNATAGAYGIYIQGVRNLQVNNIWIKGDPNNPGLTKGIHMEAQYSPLIGCYWGTLSKIKTKQLAIGIEFTGDFVTFCGGPNSTNVIGYESTRDTLGVSVTNTSRVYGFGWHFSNTVQAFDFNRVWNSAIYAVEWEITDVAVTAVKADLDSNCREVRILGTRLLGGVAGAYVDISDSGRNTIIDGGGYDYSQDRRVIGGITTYAKDTASGVVLRSLIPAAGGIVSGDALFDVLCNGKHRWGDGTGDADVTLERDAIGSLLVTGGLANKDNFITCAATITPDLKNGYNIRTILNENTTIGIPLNPQTGAIITFNFRQADSVGTYTVSWNAVFKTEWSDTGAAISKYSTIQFIYNGTYWIQLGKQSGYMT